MQNGIDWEAKFGEKWNAMSPDERNMAIYIAIVEFYSFARKTEKRYSELPCQDCNDNKLLKVSKWKFKTELTKGWLVILGSLLTLLMTWILTGRL